MDNIPRVVKGSVGEILKKKDERDATQSVGDVLDINKLSDNQIATLSGGELQVRNEKKFFSLVFISSFL